MTAAEFKRTEDFRAHIMKQLCAELDPALQALQDFRSALDHGGYDNDAQHAQLIEDAERAKAIYLKAEFLLQVCRSAQPAELLDILKAQKKSPDAEVEPLDSRAESSRCE